MHISSLPLRTTLLLYAGLKSPNIDICLVLTVCIIRKFNLANTQAEREDPEYCIHTKQFMYRVSQKRKMSIHFKIVFENV